MGKRGAVLADPEAVLRKTREPEFQQDRARRTYLALIDAATELFARDGYDAIGTPQIAEAAGVAVGTVYRYFADKQELYVECARRAMMASYDDSIGALRPEQFAGKDRRETIRVAVKHALGNMLSRPALTRSFTEMSMRDPAVAELRRAFEQLAVARMATLIGAVVPRAQIADPEAIAYVLYAMVMETAYSLVNPFRPPLVDAERVEAALVTFVERTLFPA